MPRANLAGAYNWPFLSHGWGCRMRGPISAKGPRMITASSPTRQHDRDLASRAGRRKWPRRLPPLRSWSPRSGSIRRCIAPAQAAAARFRLRVPRSYVARMRRGRSGRPAAAAGPARWSRARRMPPTTSTDPLGEHAALRAPGLLQKYHGRALLITTSACAVHCRYCFRREFPYCEQTSDAPRWSAALDGNRARHFDRRGDSQRRRSAVAERRAPHESDGRIAEDSSPPAPARAYPPTGRAAVARR